MMARTTKYKECAMTLKSFLCRKYGGYKRDINKQCVGCPADGMVCSMMEILQSLEYRSRKNDNRENS